MQSKPFLIFLGILILVFAWSIFGFLNKMEETEKNKKIVEDKIAELEQQKEKLTSDINSLKYGARKRRRLFRENFGLAKEGENEIMIIDDKNARHATPNPHLPDFLVFLKNLFK